VIFTSRPYRRSYGDDSLCRVVDLGFPVSQPRRARTQACRSSASVALLLAGGAIYFVLGDLQDALVLLVFATMSVIITVVQEARTERVLEALRDLASPRALVIRDGQPKRIAGREVVRGDLILLAEGDRVPADALLVRSQELQIDESLLTGESVPVRKMAGTRAATVTGRRPGGDDLPYVFSGSLVVRGTGTAEVTATGVSSEIGKVGQSLGALEREPPRLQAQTRRVVAVFAMAGGAVSVLAVLLYGALRGGWLDAVLGGIALGMSMLPEELPVVLAVFMAMGAWRISRADPPRCSYRDSRLRDCAVHGQDRHPDREPDVDRRIAAWGRTDFLSASAGRCRLACRRRRSHRIRRSRQCARSLRPYGEGIP
jgi:magnesium-transporting ATPase (P-type)